MLLATAATAAHPGWSTADHADLILYLIGIARISCKNTCTRQSQQITFSRNILCNAKNYFTVEPKTNVMKKILRNYPFIFLETKLME
jgi:hypothetical protein